MHNMTTYLLASRFFFTFALLFIRLTYLLATMGCVTFTRSLVQYRLQ
jgi:hypothetical protein